MKSAAQKITVTCPRCKKQFRASFRPMIDLSLEPFTDEEIEELTTAACPKCGHRVKLDTLVTGREEEPLSGAGEPAFDETAPDEEDPDY